MFNSGTLSINSSNIIGSINVSHILSDAWYKTTVLFNHISIPVLILLVIGIIYCGKKSHKLKSFLYVIGICAVVLLGGYYLEINKDYNRLALDASTMIGIFTAFLIGSTLNNFKNITLKMLIWTLVLAGCIPNIVRWIA
jgi:predicted neutral ceramidase superfamily lipid hydrolase